MKKSAAENILMILKMRGEVSAATLAGELKITKEGVRLHMLKLLEKGLVVSESKSEGVGRPLVYYALSEKGKAEFPDTHAQITVELLKSVRKLLGENALDLLISDREAHVYKRYEDELKEFSTLEDRLKHLAKLRSEEGYMATWKKEDTAYYLTENHCPICAAATECQGFCRSELNNFRQLLGENYEVERVQHIIASGQRCVYQIREKHADS